MAYAPALDAAIRARASKNQVGGAGSVTVTEGHPARSARSTEAKIAAAVATAAEGAFQSAPGDFRSAR
jgi:hypothetical protein